MKRYIARKVWLLGIGLLALSNIGLIGCGGPGYKKAQKTSSHIEDFKAELLSARSQIGIMMDAVNQVVSTADSNPQPAYEAFQTEVKNTNKQGSKVNSRANAIKKAGMTYFKTWEAEYEKMANPEMKASFEKRKAELSAQYKKIADYSQQIDADYKVFMKDIDDIQLALGMDLTSKGIKSVAGFIEKATTDSLKVQEHVDTYISILDQVANALSTSTQETTL